MKIDEISTHPTTETDTNSREILSPPEDISRSFPVRSEGSDENGTKKCTIIINKVERERAEKEQENLSKKGEKKFKCHSCDKAFDKAAKLYKHIKDVHEKKIPCDVCEKKFTYTRDLKSHAKNVHKISSNMQKMSTEKTSQKLDDNDNPTKKGEKI